MRRGLTALTVGVLAFCSVSTTAQTKTRPERLLELSRVFSERLEQRRPANFYDMLASVEVPQKRLNENRDIQLVFLDEGGHPRYFAVENLNAARTVSTDDLWPGGSSGLNLSGGTTPFGRLAVWDGGGVLSTHQELSGRVLQADGAYSSHYHATHVAGTMVGSGLVGQAKGMSFQAILGAYDWDNDDAEMAAAAADGLQISNHSYGIIAGWRYDTDAWYWWGDLAISTTEDYGFGYYSNGARGWDEIAYEAPYYLIVTSAGNDRSDTGPAPGETYYVFDGSWVESTDPRDPDCGPSGYDCVSWNSTAKNILTVGAINDIASGYSNPSGVSMSGFSAWGPTDDGRIKPDIVANGVSLYSCYNTSNTSYAYLSGTSMSSPSASGSINLLAGHYEATHAGELPRASTLKALVIHTADEAGPSTGPDYMFGWGLMNASKAALVISADVAGSDYIVEGTLDDAESHEHHLTSAGTTPLRVTLAWTDLPGMPPSPAIDPHDLMLVNDLDISLEHLASSTVYFPYVLNPASPSSAATTGDNFRDNVEQIYVAAPAAGEYVLRVSHKGSLAASEVYSLISTLPLQVCVDYDGDGYGDPGNPANSCAEDNCPDDYNPDQADSDDDGIGDLCDVCPYDAADDADADGHCSDVDNCSAVYNPDQADTDGDLVGDACDLCAGYDDALDSDGDTVPDGCDLCAGYDDTQDVDGDLIPDDCDNCREVSNPYQEDITGDGIGDACCCQGRVGDVNMDGNDEPTIGDISMLIDYLFISGATLPCTLEADVNQSGGQGASQGTDSDITISDISVLIDYLFITGSGLGLPQCL